MRKVILSESQVRQLFEVMDEAEAYHGGPHKFDKFSTDFAHSGEGANTQGFGVYVTLDKDTTAYYYATYKQMTELKHSTIFVNGVPMKGSMEGGYVGDFRDDYPSREGYNEYNGIKISQHDQEVLFFYINAYNNEAGDNGGQVTVSELSRFLQGKLDKVEEMSKIILAADGNFSEKAVSAMIDTIVFNNHETGSCKSCSQAMGILGKFSPDDVLEIPSGKHFEQYIYRLDIPDVNGENYFDWDAGIDGQINWDDEYIRSYKDYIGRHESYYSERHYDNFNHIDEPSSFENLYNYLSEQVFKSDEKTSGYFYSHGKHGHYYQSQFGNLNVVVYNADDVKILDVERV